METSVRQSHYIVCVELQKIIPEINARITAWCKNNNIDDIENELITLRPQDIFPDLGIDINSIDFLEIRNRIENEKDFYKSEKVELNYKNIIYNLKKESSDKDKIKYLNKHDYEFRKNNLILENALKLRAATYLYRGILFRQNEPSSKKGIFSIRKAVEYNPAYMPYLVEAKQRNTLEDKQLEKYLSDILKDPKIKKDKPSNLKALEKLAELLQSELYKNISNKEKDIDRIKEIKNKLPQTYADIIFIYSNFPQGNKKKSVFLGKLAKFYENISEDPEKIIPLYKEILELDGIAEKTKEKSLKRIIYLHKKIYERNDKITAVPVWNKLQFLIE